MVHLVCNQSFTCPGKKWAHKHPNSYVGCPLHTFSVIDQQEGLFKHRPIFSYIFSGWLFDLINIYISIFPSFFGLDEPSPSWLIKKRFCQYRASSHQAHGLQLRAAYGRGRACALRLLRIPRGPAKPKRPTAWPKLVAEAFLTKMGERSSNI